MNPRVTAIEPSAIRALAERKRPDSIDLGLGEPTLLPSMRWFEAALATTRERGTRYTVNAGEIGLRERIAAHYAYPGMNEAGNVCVTTGSQEAVYVAIKALLDPRSDELLIVEPAFPAYAKIAQLEGITVRRVAMPAQTGFAFDAAAIAAALTERTRMIVVCSPCNPTGRMMRDADARTLAAALAQRPGPPVYVLHDEIYRELTFAGGAGHLASHHPHTIVANSLSKSNALTGMRIGWLLAPDGAIGALVKTHAWVTSSANTFSQRIAHAVFEAQALGEHAAWYREQHGRVVAELEASHLRFVVPEGSFYAFVHVGDGVDSIAFAHDLIERDNVIAIPGAIFSDAAEGWLRISWVAPIGDVREGVRRIAAASTHLDVP